MTLVFYRGLKMQNALQRDFEGKTDYSMVAVDPSRISKGELPATLSSLFRVVHIMLMVFVPQTLAKQLLDIWSKPSLLKADCYLKSSTSTFKISNMCVLVM